MPASGDRQTAIPTVFHHLMIVTAISTMSVTLGATLAFAASGFPRHQAVLETFAGWLMIGGLGLLGYAIGCVIGQP